MKTATYLLAVATFLVAPSLSATQSGFSIQASAGELSPEVQLSIGRGDELTGRLRYDAAARRGAPCQRDELEAGERTLLQWQPGWRRRGDGSAHG